MLLAARHGPGNLLAPLAKFREQGQNPVEISLFVHPRPLTVGAEPQVLLDIEIAEDGPPFRHERDAAGDDLVRISTEQGLPGEADIPVAMPFRQTGDGAQQRRLAGSVRAENDDHLALRNPHGDIVQRAMLAIADGKIFDLKHQTSSPI